MGPLVSIVIPCYNAAPWLAETLDSCFRQTHLSIEVIFVDNGSMDNSVEVAKRCGGSRLLVTTCERKGASAARNVGLQLAQGEFIQYLDADDLLSPDKIEMQLAALRESSADLMGVCRAVHFFDGDDKEQGVVHDGWPLVDTADTADWLVELLGPEAGGMVPLGCWLTPTGVAKQAGPWNEALTVNDDGEYFARVVLAATGIRRSSGGAYYYRKHRTGQNLSAQKKAAHWRSTILSLDLIAENLLKKRDGERAKKALARGYMDIAFSTFPTQMDMSTLALERVRELGGTRYIPKLDTWKGNLLQSILGWRNARRLSHFIHKYRSGGVG